MEPSFLKSQGPKCVPHIFDQVSKVSSKQVVMWSLKWQWVALQSATHRNALMHWYLLCIPGHVCPVPALDTEHQETEISHPSL
jgi:hypothetical protein